MDEKELKPNKDNSWLQPVLMFYAKVTSWIIAPIGIAILVSRMTENEKLLLPATIVGFLITIYGIYREIKVYKKSLDGDK